ncbi:MAG TPA: DivIVA domain-containing protein [Chthonomonadales bacterium]|nr:DivIVA domain-containing protein [Chthonomonadales bacterium]
MRLAPIDLINKRFPRSLRGYAPAAVEDFLREIALDYEAIVAENARLRERMDTLEQEVSRYAAMEHTLKEALLLAQKAAEDMRGAAKREADAHLRNAEVRAAAIIAEAERCVEATRLQRIRFACEFRALLQTYLEYIEADLARLSPLPEEGGVQSTIDAAG